MKDEKIKQKGETKQFELVEIHPDSASLGAGTGITHTYEELFLCETWRVIMNRDIIH